MKKVLMILCALCTGFAYADNVPENKIVSSKEYVDSQLVDKQPVFGANANNVAVFTDDPGVITPKLVTETLTGNGVSNTDLPTVGAVNSGLDTKQNEIGRPIVPNGYTQLEYIESNGTQYIDTGIVENTIDYMEMDFENKTSNGFMFVNGSTQLGVQDSRYGTTEQNKRYKIKQELSNNKWQFINITNGTVYTQSYNTGTSKLWLFRLNNHGGFASVKIYNFLCSASGVVRCNLIPARRNSDNVIGMYDTVTETFFTNSGTGTFIAGPAVAIIGATGTVVTYTDIPGTLGAKGIYQDTGTYADQMNTLIDAGTFNTALAGALDSEFVCANRPDAYDPVTGNCWLWEISTLMLPSGYTQLEYIGLTGTQRIDTGIIFDSSVGYRIVFQPTSTDKWVTSTSNGRGQLIAQRTGKWECRTLSTTLQTNQPVNTSAFATLTYNIDNACSVDGVQTSFDGQNLNDGGRILVPGTSYPATGYIKSMQIYSNGTIVRDMIPARRNSDDTIGMYDTVSNTFFTNSGSGIFVGGPVANNVYLPQNQ